MKFKSFFWGVFFIGLLLCGNSIAGDVENKTKELSGLKAKIKQITKVVKNLKSDRKSLQAELKVIEVSYGESVSRLQSLKRQINQINKDLEKNKQQRKEKQQQIRFQKQSLEKQVKAAYGMGKNEKLKLMLNQQDPALSGRVMVYYDFFNKRRLKKIAAINQDIQVLGDLERQHQQESEQLEQKRVARKQRQLELLGVKKERKSVLMKLNKQVQSKKQQLRRFKQSEKKLAALIGRLQQTRDDFPLNEGVVKPFGQLKGELPWPVRGRLLKKFGEKRSESRWDGVLIEAKEGQEVKSVARGQVVYADWLRGYGLLTIIKHDKGYMTLYAFNQSLYKAKGDWVDAGTVISTVGLSGGRSNAGLYFGIRRKGKPVNPVKWCRKTRRGKTR